MKEEYSARAFFLCVKSLDVKMRILLPVRLKFNEAL